MNGFEKLGVFYLGREFDLESRTPTDTPVLYDSRDLVTHAVAVGMTGSGKTGLCLALIEEAAIDGVPVIAIDPKGDLGNLLLTFPSLAPDAFRPWIDEDEAHRAGQTPAEHAVSEAKKWSEGLAEWQQDGDRIARLRAAAEFAIYTPGSRAGIPVSVLSSFAAPSTVQADQEAMADRAAAVATSVLSLAGSESAPRTREHSLLSSIFMTAWSAGRNLDFAELIQQVQTPPFQSVGILDLESFFPQKDRFALALTLNGILASPGFSQWFDGEPLDPATLLRTNAGKPRVSIFSIAHLGDAERMFFVSLLLNQIVGWMRTQSGTSSLRAIVYMDEIAGYFPPVATPPSKAPLLTLLKQARAFGVGVLLATQNPIDLDYKGLANTGTWFLGRLQTERDKARVLDGLEGAAAGSLDRAEADRTLSALGKRVFMLHNVHQPKPVIFQTRWTMSYLRGPLSKEQIRKITQDTGLTPPSRESADATAAAGRGGRSGHATAARPAPRFADRDQSPTSGVVDRTASAGVRPVVPPGIDQYFLPAAADRADVHGYAPVVIAAARVNFSDARLGIDASREIIQAVEISNGAMPLDWQQSKPVDAQLSDLQSAPSSQTASFEPVPPAALQPKNYTTWSKTFTQWLAQSQRLELLRHAPTKLTSRADEDEHQFRARVIDAMRESRDAEVEALRKRFASRRESLAERIRRAEGTVQREEQQASQQKTQTMLSAGAAVIGALLGRKVLSSGNLGRATTAARGVGRSVKESEDVERAAANLTAMRKQLEEFDARIQQETEAIAARYESELQLEPLSLAPKRGQIIVHFVALGWDPR